MKRPERASQLAKWPASYRRRWCQQISVKTNTYGPKTCTNDNALFDTEWRLGTRDHVPSVPFAHSFAAPYGVALGAGRLIPAAFARPHLSEDRHF